MIQQIMRDQERPHIRSSSLDDEATKSPEDDVQLQNQSKKNIRMISPLLADRYMNTDIRLAPLSWLAKALDQITTRQQHDLVLSAPPITHRQTSAVLIQHLVKVIEDDGRALVLGLSSFPGIDH